MIEALVALLAVFVVGAVVLVLGLMLLGLLFGLAAGLFGLLVKLAPVLLVGWIVLRWLERRKTAGPSAAPRLPRRAAMGGELVREEDEVWLDS